MKIDNKQEITNSEWHFVWLIVGVLLILTTIPYLFGYAIASADKQFMGFVLNVEDHTQYLAWYKAFQSSFLIPNTLTAESNPPVFFNLLWWLLAQAGGITGLRYDVIYQIFRWISGAAFLMVLYWFLSIFFKTVFQRRFVFMVIAIGSGLGWILVVLKYTLLQGELLFPLDLYVAEGNTFLSMLGYPHFLEAGAFILGTIGLLLRAEQTRSLRYAVYAGIVAFLLGWQHGYDLLIVWFVPGIYAVITMLRERQFSWFWFKAMLLVGIISLPPAIYNVLLTRMNPIWKDVLAQFSNAGVYTPSPPHYLIFMGIPFMIALVVVGRILWGFVDRQRSCFLTDLEVFTVSWFFVGWVLTYIPTDFQIHMINSFQVPVGILVGMGFFRVIEKANSTSSASPGRQKLAALLVLLAILPTNLYLFAWRFVDLKRQDYPFFLYKDEIKALEWLNTNAQPGEIVFSSLEVGQFIPGLTAQRAFLAHWAQTVDFYHKRDTVNRFFSSGLSDVTLLEPYSISYVLFGPAERRAGEEPIVPVTWKMVYSNDQVRIFKTSSR